MKKATNQQGDENTIAKTIGFNVLEENSEKLNLEDVDAGATKKEATKIKTDFDINIDDVLPFIDGFLKSFGGNKSDEKTVNNTDNSANDNTKNISFNFNFGDVRIHTAK